MQIRTKLKLSSGRLGGMLAIGWVLFALAMLGSPVVSSRVWADEESDMSAKESLRSETNLWIKPTLAIALSSKIDLEVVPKSTGVFATEAATLTVDTNSINGFKVLLNAVNGTDLVAGDEKIKTVIKSLQAEATKADFEDNAWGYYVGSETVNDETVYSPIPAVSTEVLKTKTAGSRQNYKVAFGTKINTSLPAGLYTNEVAISVVANPIAVTLNNLYYMQEMQPAICEATAEGISKQLVDIRDGQKYWVTKMRNGRCLMSQNLALDLTTEGLLAETSDMGQDWNQSSSYAPIATRKGNFVTTGYGQDTPASFNLGKYVFAKPLDAKYCAAKGGNLSEECKVSAGIIDVSDEALWQPGFKAQQGTIKMPDGSSYTGYVAVNLNNPNDASKGGIYDEHYLMGNYYFYNAATAGSGGPTTVGVNAADSICPKGWQLPYSTAQYNADTTSFHNLLQSYGGLSGTNWTDDKGQTHSLFEAPFYFVRAGGMEANSFAIGGGGLYIAATAGSNAGQAYYLDATTSGVNSMNLYSRAFGRSIRCVNRI